MALASFATKAVSGLGLRCGLPALATRAYATGEPGAPRTAPGGRGRRAGWETRGAGTCSAPAAWQRRGQQPRISGDAAFPTPPRQGLPPPSRPCRRPLLTANTPLLPAVIDGLKYAQDHEWIKVEGDVATVGITDHAQVRARAP